jgi:uridine kinase
VALCSENEFFRDDYLAEHGISYQLQNIEYNILLSSCNIFAICGDSGSGKSTLGNVLKQYFSSSFMLEGDRYHKWERHDDNWKKFTHLNPESNFLTKMSQDIFDLKVGKTIYQVDYDHATGKFTDKEQIGSSDNIIVCGLNSLYLDNNHLFNLKIFIDTDERLKYHWKIRRDVHERGHTLEHVLEQIASRKDDYEQFIASQRSKSDLVIKFFPRIEDPELFETPENLSLKLYIRTNYNLREILDAFLDRGVEFQMKKSEQFYELTFEHYQECELWDNRHHPHTNNFYDYIVFAITLLKSP